MPLIFWFVLWMLGGDCVVGWLANISETLLVSMCREVTDIWRNLLAYSAGLWRNLVFWFVHLKVISEPLTYAGEMYV